MMRRKTLRSAIVLALISSCTSKSSSPPGSAGPGETDIQLVTLSTWLGQLDPIVEKDADGNSHSYGGLATLSAYFKADRAANPNTLVLLTADSFGASPPLSGLFQDEPAIQGLNFLGVTADALGNHNFNDGIPYLRHLIDLSNYVYVSTNMDNVTGELGSKVAAPYRIEIVGTGEGAIKVALLGITSTDAPKHTFPGRFGSIAVREPIASASAAAKDARAAGASVVVVLTDLETTGVDASGGHTGPLIDFASAVTGIDVALGFKADSPESKRYGDALVVENEWKGRRYGKIQIKVVGGVVSATSGEIISPDGAAVTPDPEAEALLAPYRASLAEKLDEAVGVASAKFPLDGSERVSEAAIGDLLADAMLEKYRAIGAQIAITNSGGIREEIPASSYAPANVALRRPTPGFAAGPPFDVVVGDAYAVLPFGDSCVVRPVTGAALWAALEASVFAAPDANKGYLQIAGFKFTYKQSSAPGARVQSVTLEDGTPVTKDDKAYVLVDNDFVDSGGDGYGMLVQKPAAALRDVMAGVLLDYIRAHPDLVPAVAGRITQIP
jgi:5'-nucleotidase